ncbi:MAG: hypothetical protein CVT49_12400 [candidate division Zixibacteria bacterium HGW-Zixibacteria-1]|nr:MAG: hypothetical protein CVT49_12400 [candidate division Zixibacteria bacterium HGW-Zixibacteria-1]
MFSSGDCPGERLVLAPGEDYVLSTGEAFRLYSFPALVPIYTPASNQATGGGFLTSPGKAYYFYDNRDTLYTIDFSNAALIVETAIPLRMNGNPFYPSNAALHASGKKLVFIEGDPAGTTDIMILDSDNLGFIEGAHADWWYRDIEIHPDGNRVFLSCYWSLLDDESRNRVDIYNIGSGQFTSFLGVHDIEGETAFQPQQMVITPDGGMIYFRSGLYTGGMTITSEFTALGISVASRQLINRIKPENPVASLIAIDPTRHE